MTVAPKAVAPHRVAPPTNFQTHWQDETQYILEVVAADLAEMAVYAKNGSAASLAGVKAEAYEIRPTAIPTYDVVVTLGPGRKPVTTRIELKEPIWAPESYLALARALFGELQLQPQTREDSPSQMPQTLLRPKAETLAAADVALSKSLASDFTDPVHHEEAALLLAAFTLREPVGLFYQARSELSRIAAHLAFADALRGTASTTPTGKLADAALTALYNNQVDALAKLEKIADTETTSAWKRALQMHITDDFRIIGQSPQPTLLETREWYRARAISVDIDWAWHDLRLDEEEAAMADWTRIAQNERYSVSLGHKLLRRSLQAELAEIQEVVLLEGGKALTAETLVPTLNLAPGRCVSIASGQPPEVHVIGLGRWAAFAQRNICRTIVADFDFQERKWGVPEEASEYRSKVDQAFGGLVLYPFVRRQNATEVDYYHRAQDEEMALVRRSPEMIPSEAWNKICYNVSFCPRYIPPPHAFINEWHRPNPPPGTVYHIFPRLNHPSLTNQPNLLQRLEQLHRQAPYDYDLADAVLEARYGEKATAAQKEEAYAAFLDFTPGPCSRLAKLNEKNPAEFERWMSKAAALNPAYLEDLGDWYVRTGREDLAAQTYLQWIANEINELRVAESAEWLVNYFERKGDMKSAAILAERAGRTGSAAGLQTQARHYARNGRVDDALDIHLRLRERYDRDDFLIEFLATLPPERQTARCKAEWDKIIKPLFPQGLQRIALSGKAAPPQAGVRVDRVNDRTREAGLQVEDVIVAVRGYAVTNWATFKFLRAMDPVKQYSMTVWRKSEYITLPPMPASHRFGYDLPDYHAPEAQERKMKNE